MTPKKIPYEDFLAIYSRVPRLCVEPLIETENGIVLTKRAIEPFKGIWHIPGGTVLRDETIEEALRRVAREEAGIKIDIKEWVGIGEYNNIPDYPFHDITMIFRVVPAGKKYELRHDDQADKIACFTEIPRNILPFHGDFLTKSLGYKKTTWID